MNTRKTHLMNSQNFIRLVELFDVSNTGLWEMDPQGNVIFYNDLFYTAFDIPVTNSTLDDWIKLIHPDDKDLFSERLTHHYESNVESYKSEYRVINKAGDTVWIEALGIAHYDDEGNVISMVGYHTDITLERTYKEHLYRAAYIDEKTGLYNRKKLLEEIETDLNSEKSSTLIVIEIYRYHQLLSIHGHEFVDQMIKNSRIATALILKDQWTPFRLSPSEIGLLCHEKQSDEEVTSMLFQMNQALNQLSEAQNLSGNIKLTAGILTYPISTLDVSAEDLIKRTYLALNESKRLGEGTITFYQENNQSNMLRNLFIEHNILKGLKKEEFFMVYQPIVDAATHDIVYFESLIRWQSEKWGPISPIDFIPVAERNHEIIELGDFVLNQSLAFISRYNDHHGTNVKVTINVSVTQLVQQDFASKVINALKNFSLDYNTLILEVTESIMIDNPTLVVEQLKQLKDLGVGIALDDFGSGYASLNACILLPLTEVKMDRQIMLQALDQPLIFNFLKHVVNLFHDYDAKVIAEGIETMAMIETSEQLHIDMLQGYYFTKPLNNDEAITYTSKPRLQ